MKKINLTLKCFLNREEGTVYIFENENGENIRLVLKETNFPLEIDREYTLSLMPKFDREYLL